MLSLSDCPCCISLRKDLEAPKTKVADYHTLKAKVADYDTIKEQVAILAVKNQSITIREICRVAEKKLCLENVGGSASKMRKSHFVSRSLNQSRLIKLFWKRY